MTKSEILEELHLELTTQLLKKVKSGEATAADLGVARQFLKDNGIEVANPANHKPLQALTEVLPFRDTGT